MSEVTLTIGGRRHTVSCADGEEAHIAELGRIIDGKLMQMGSQASQDSKNLLFASLLLADELHEARSGKTPDAGSAHDAENAEMQAKLAELKQAVVAKDAELAATRESTLQELSTLKAQVDELLAQKESVRAAHEGLRHKIIALEEEREAMAATAEAAARQPVQALAGSEDLAPALERFAELLENCADKLEA